MGALGGRPDQALFFVGLQDQDFIFLDPHLVQESVTHDEEYVFNEWEDFKALAEEEGSEVSTSQKASTPIIGRKNAFLSHRRSTQKKSSLYPPKPVPVPEPLKKIKVSKQNLTF